MRTLAPAGAGTRAGGGGRELNAIFASAFRWRERFMLARITRWPVMAAAIAGLLLSACAPTSTGTGSPTPGTSPSASTSPVSKMLRMARNAEPFSPFVPWQIDDNPALFISVNVYDTLLRTTKDGTNVEPGLATKWESSADGLTWTFTLRDGLKFSDGSAMKASDVKASLDMARGGEKSAWKDVYKAIKDITASDDKTVKITLSQPYAPLLSVLAMFSGGVLPAVQPDRGPEHSAEHQGADVLDPADRVRHPQQLEAAAQRREGAAGVELRDGQGSDHQERLLRTGEGDELADPARHVLRQEPR